MSGGVRAGDGGVPNLVRADYGRATLGPLARTVGAGGSPTMVGAAGGVVRARGRGNGLVVAEPTTMTRGAGHRVVDGGLDAGGARFGIVVSRFNAFITERLLDAALDALTGHGAAAADITVVHVPGAWEIPQAAA